jgi:O-acetyl-ADP-ribose deacetylase (regulator of RNase III)
MIQYVKGNLLEAPVMALVNTVNTDGVMGKGIALQFKEAYPANYRFYQQACKNGLLTPGGLLAFQDLDLHGPRTIVNFATKKEWYRKSRYEWIETGLQKLAIFIQQERIASIALPPLGCGNGGLNWDKIRGMIEEHLGSTEHVKIVVYEPNEAIKELLQQQDGRKEINLTPARAMLLYAMYYYESLGEAPNLFVANKLAWFLQRMGEPLRLEFTKHLYGPYTLQIQHVLYFLNGKYLKGLEQNQIRPFEPLQLQYETFQEVKTFIDQALSPEQTARLVNLAHLIAGFQSAWSLEVLASVDYLLSEKPGQTADQLFVEIQNWNPRKKKHIQKQHVEIALKRLETYRNL